MRIRLRALAVAEHRWPESAATPDDEAGWQLESRRTVRLAELFTRVLDEVLTADPHDATKTDLITATSYGTARVAENMHRRIRSRGVRWLEPEEFIFYSPHSVTSFAARRLGLGGPAETLLGPRSGAQALEHAVRRLSAGRCERFIVAGYDALSPFGQDALGRPGSSELAEVAAVSLSAETSGGPGLTLTRVAGPVQSGGSQLSSGRSPAVGWIWSVKSMLDQGRLSTDSPAESSGDKVLLLPARRGSWAVRVG